MSFRTTLKTRISLILALVLFSLLPASMHATVMPEWTRPITPFRIAGNLYYVGSADLAAYLVVTPAGNILINSNLVTSPPQIRHSVEQLGFHWKDTKILLISHAHFDHAAGSAQILRETGAKYWVMDTDVEAIETGGRISPEPNFTRYPLTKVNHTLHDGEEVRLGGAVLVAHKTAGHTPGCTTWTMRVIDGGRTYNAVIMGSPNINAGTKLVNNPIYPGIADDFAAGFRVLHNLPCDIFLGAHGIYFDMLQKVARMTPNGPNVFVDPEGYQAYVAKTETTFKQELAKQQPAGQ